MKLISNKMMFLRQALAITLLMFISINAQAFPGKRLLNKSNCYEHFQSLTDGLSFSELKDIARKLTKRDLQCLYRSTAMQGPPQMAFFLPVIHGEAAVIFGKNSLPFGNEFEKHTFSLAESAENGSKDTVFGYNFHRKMRFTGPGFFSVGLDANEAIIDFRGDFNRIIPSRELSVLSNVKTAIPRNNHFNIFYGGETIDKCHKLLFDKEAGRDIAVVCEGTRSFLGIRHTFIWDILIRQW